MRFMTMVKSVENKAGPPPKALMDAIAQLGIEATKAGVLVETGGLLPTAKGATIRLSGERAAPPNAPRRRPWSRHPPTHRCLNANKQVL